MRNLVRHLDAATNPSSWSDVYFKMRHLCAWGTCRQGSNMLAPLQPWSLYRPSSLQWLRAYILLVSSFAVHLPPSITPRNRPGNGIPVTMLLGFMQA